MAKTWDYLKVVCGECGAELDIHKGDWGTFYGCTEYPKCYNRFTTSIYEEMLDKVTDYVAEHGSAKGYQFAINRGRLKIEARVIRETPNQVVLGVSNLRQRAHRPTS